MKNFSLGLLLLFSATLASKRNGVTRIALHKVSDNDIFESFQNSVEAMKKQWESNTKELTEVELYHQYGDNYFGEIEIGTPVQKFNVSFYTSSGINWIASSRCIVDLCSRLNLYDRNLSSTYVEDGRNVELQFSNQYVVSGVLSTDTLRISSLEVTDQTFIEAMDGHQCKEIQMKSMYFTPTDGIVGLALPGSDVDRVPTLLENMYAQSLLDRNMFSLWYNRTSGPLTENGGVLVLGGSDENLYTGPMTYIDIVAGNLWEVKMERVDIDGDTIGCEDGCTAVLDSGVFFMTGPSEDIKAIHKRIGAELVVGTNHYSISCNMMEELPIIHMRLGGNNFELPPYHYITNEVGSPNGQSCITNFINTGLSVGEKWVLGGQFLNLFYLEFDLEQRRVGFATARR